MSGNDLEKFRFPKTLSEQNRIIGLPLDEAIPAAVLVLWGFFAKKYVFGLIIATVVSLPTVVRLPESRATNSFFRR